ncbi:lysophospholipid acyltransferase LPEAT1 isoform X1 [Beta vulgaris subsp. vulgaris]|uniref:lysophospholipid acyltransferase LPEAT1 isoform X1 n=1 Tax=Beta vulgaris subsp. vulgaris TaxID=3555 RepID=UPI002036B004|nr:lysophospholipid acyltransferase LPEAT1 isoform X1 [Beta vulgaris subsp. vulgaris]
MDTELKSLNQNQNQNENENHPKQYQQEPIDNGDLPLLKSDSSPSDYQRTNQIPEEKHFTAEEFEDIEKKFAAYVRHDIYGPMGRGQLPMAEKFLLFLAMFTLLPLRIFIGMSILVFYYIICRICTLFSSPYRLDEGDDPQQQQQQQHEDYSHLGGWRRQIIVCCGRFLSRALLFTLGFYWISQTSRIQSDSRDQLENSERPGVVISNHISYLDILYHMSTSFPSFVAKRSVGKLPLVGLISKCLGCVYVQREDKSSDFKGVSGVVTERIKEAHDISDAPLMLIFPEGTTTNGNFLLPFKTGAFLAGAPVLPVILRYPYQRFSPAWDSISGVRHVILLLCQFVNFMEVVRLPIYYPSKEEKDDPKLYANNMRKLMANEGNLILSDVGLPEKRTYHAALNGNNSLRSVFHQKTD